MLHIGVWEDDVFIGVVLFSRGACQHLLKKYGLEQTEGCELTRVALRAHQTPVSRIVAIAIKFLRRKCPGLRLIVSFADPFQGHVGGIYQAGNWIYSGRSASSVEYKDKNGRIWHARMVKKNGIGTVFGKKRRVMKTEDVTPIRKPGKHRYLMPLDNAMRKHLQAVAKPYPKASEV